MTTNAIITGIVVAIVVPLTFKLFFYLRKREKKLIPDAPEFCVKTIKFFSLFWLFWMIVFFIGMVVIAVLFFSDVLIDPKIFWTIE